MSIPQKQALGSLLSSSLAFHDDVRRDTDPFLDHRAAFFNRSKVEPLHSLSWIGKVKALAERSFNDVIAHCAAYFFLKTAAESSRWGQRPYISSPIIKIFLAPPVDRSKRH
jgi:hypothetical protein